VLKGQLSTSECPSGFQAANGLIAAIGIGTFTECWPENAWAANRLGGSIWEQFKNSGGTYDAKAEIDRRNKVNELKALAKSVAQTAADQTPGIQRCSKWTGYGESGEECAYTFVSPSTTTESTSTKSTQETSTASTSSTASSEGSNSSSTTASLDPFPSLKNGEEIPNTRITSSPGLTQSEWEQTSTYRSHTCPSGSGRASGIDLNFTISKSDDKWFTYCIKSFQNSTLASGNTAEDVSKSSSVNSQTSTSDTSTASTSTSDTSTASTSTSDTSTASTSSSSTDPQVSLQEDPTLQTSAIQVSGSIGELKPLVSKVVEDKREARAISSLMSRLDAVVSKTSIKKIKLPGSSRIDETVVSLTPEVCSVSGLSISSQAKGTCVLAFTVTDTNGNTFTTEKEIYFRK